jgi:hypothetical protein
MDRAIGSDWDKQVILKKEYGVWVYQGEPSDESISDLIERDREKRARELGD